MGNTPNKESDPSTEYYQLVSESNLTGNTWEELVQNISRHIESGAIDKEWEKLGEKEAERTDVEDLYSAARAQHNMEKNRYINILPFDSTRVKLNSVEGVKGSDYINANLVSTGERVYIASQAPMENTLHDFHRMLWENNVKIIIMLTRFVEGGKIKATEYFPPLNDPPKKYGEFEVQVTNEEGVKDFYVIRKFVLQKGEEKRIVTQFHFLAWPDHGVPEESAPLLEMMLRAEKLQNEANPNLPMAVHCSAGIGRTGTYIVVNAIADQIDNSIRKDKIKPPTINLMKTLHQLRGMRSGMVTHKDQYEFCYKVVLAYLLKVIVDNNLMPPNK